MFIIVDSPVIQILTFLMLFKMLGNFKIQTAKGSSINLTD